MSDAVCYGVRLPNSGPFASAENVLDIADRVEALGYDGIWVHDHISWTRDKLTHFGAGSVEAVREDMDPNFYESVTTLAVLGGRLRRARLGIAGLVLPLRDPRVLAKQLGTVADLVGPERLIVAVAIGNIPNDFEVVGVPYDKRGRITTDHLAALRAILDGPQPVSFRSKSVSFEGGMFYPEPRGMRLWVTGGKDAPIDRIARYGDGWLTGNATPDEYAAMLGRIREAGEALGRDMSGFTGAFEVFVCVGRTREAAIEASTRSILRRFPTLERGLSACAVGTADDVVEQLQRFASAGASYFELKFISRTTDEMHEMMAILAERTRAAVAASSR